MNKLQIFEQVTQMEKQISELYEKLGVLKNDLSQLLEENHRLSLENEHLRTYLTPHDNKEKKKNGSKEEAIPSPPQEGFDNLARIYMEGFHICHMHFGSPRTDKDCLFCFELINQQ